MRMLNLKKLIHILNLPRYLKTFIAIIIDSTCCIVSVWFSYYLRLGNLLLFYDTGFKALSLHSLYQSLYSLSLVYIKIFLIFRSSYNPKCFKSYFGIWIILLYFTKFYRNSGIPRTIGLIQPLLF